jgi:ferritin
VTALINNLMALAIEEKDFALQSRLNWFVDEQVEEEENATDLVNKFRMVGDNGYGLYQLDQELAARVYTQASPLATAE